MRAAAEDGRRVRWSVHRRASTLAYVLLLPAFAFVVLLLAYPLYVAFSVSVRPGQGLAMAEIASRAISIENYQRMIADPSTWQSLWLSLVYTVGVSAPAFLVGLGTALLLNKRFPGRRIFRAAVLLPWPIPGVVVAITFLWMMDSTYGVLNFLLRSVGIIDANVAWFFNPDTALAAVVLPTLWKGYPFFTLTILAALQAVPEELYEAARVDGARARHQFRWVTWPGIRGAALLGMILNALWVFREFDFIYAITQGGPNRATETLAIRIYNEAFSYLDLSYASALGVLSLVVAGLAVVAVLPTMRRGDV